jgi:hypothetical protein
MLSRHTGIYCRVHFSLTHSVIMATKSSVVDPEHCCESGTKKTTYNFSSISLDSTFNVRGNVVAQTVVISFLLFYLENFILCVLDLLLYHFLSDPDPNQDPDPYLVRLSQKGGEIFLPRRQRKVMAWSFFLLKALT